MQSEVVGTGRPLVLVPGGLSGWVSWEPHAKRLSASRRVVRVQLISVQYGLEGKTLPEEYSLRTESGALANTIAELKLEEPFDIAAWSFGAAISLDYSLNHPQKVRTLTLIEPPALWTLGVEKPKGKEYQDMDEMRRTIKGDITEEQLVTFLHSAGIVPQGTDPRELPQWQGWVRYKRSLLNTNAPMDHTDDIRRLRQFVNPVLLVKGTGSAEFLHQIIDSLAQQLPNSQVIELPSGHAPHLVSMDRFLEVMEKFQS